MEETSKTIVWSDLVCFLCACSLNKDKVRVFNKSAVDILGVIKSMIDICIACYKKLTQFEKISSNLCALRWELKESFEKRRLNGQAFAERFDNMNIGNRGVKVQLTTNRRRSYDWLTAGEWKLPVCWAGVCGRQVGGGKLTYGWYFGEFGQAKLQPNIANPNKLDIALKWTTKGVIDNSVFTVPKFSLKYDLISTWYHRISGQLDMSSDCLIVNFGFLMEHDVSIMICLIISASVWG